MHTIRRLSASRHAPLVALLALTAVGLALKLAFLSTPKSLVFDEHYYVNASRRMLGIPVSGGIYANSVSGLDPNPAHPGLAKLAMYLSIQVFGDRPLAWRLPSVLFGTAAVLGIYLLARAAGAGKWTSIGAAGLASADTMLFLNSRIGTIDIYAVTLMIFAVAAYLKKRRLTAGILIGLASSAKLVALFALGIVGLMELFDLFAGKEPDLRQTALTAGRIAAVTAVTVTILLSFVFVYDSTFYSRSANPVRHVTRMLNSVTSGMSDPSLRALQKQEVQANPNLPAKGPVFIEKGKKVGTAPDARPVEWLANQRSINYYQLDSTRGEVKTLFFGRKSKQLIDFEALINPAIIVCALPALAYCGYIAVTRKDRGLFVPVAWFVGTFGPFLAADIARVPRPFFLYYMLPVMPGIYLAVAQLFSHRKLRPLVPVLAIVVVGFFWFFYPYKTWAGV